MGGRWNSIGLQILCLLVLTLSVEIQRSWSLNDEGVVLLEFRKRVHSDPFGAFADWNPDDHDPCLWCGVHCDAGKVQMLDLSGLSLEGTLAPDIGKLIHLKSLVLCNNHFSGTIPEEIGQLTNLELLDLRDNKFSGTIPTEIGKLLSLKSLLICDNKLEGSIPLDIKRLNLLSELQFDENLSAACGISCVNRKFGHRFKGKDACGECCYEPVGSSDRYVVQNVESMVSYARRRLLEQSNNLQAPPASVGPVPVQIIALPTTRSSGSFPAVPNAKKHPPPPPAAPPAVPPPPKGNDAPSDSTGKESKGQPSIVSGDKWIYFIIIILVIILIIMGAGLIFMCKKRVVKTIGPWKTGLSGQLQKAFVTGVPKLNRSELETACEDFSNIIDTFESCIAYKGTLSSGVEIAVISTSVTTSKEWSKTSQTAYRKKIDTLSRVNHKNFVNLIGYCEEDQPFNRMMVFEYAPNGTLFEHLHVKEMEHLDWNVRVRIIMGTAYCLQYMHHDLNPPVVHSNLNSRSIYLTDDYAAKISEICFWPHKAPSKSKISGDDESEHSTLPALADAETNVYSFGILLLEIISGKLPYSEEQGPLEKWAAQYLNDKRSISYMIDPSLKSFKNDELDLICEIIQECIQPEPRKRPTMRDVISKLREVIAISPEQACPRLSPLWWAELEILSVEAN
ncbi:hypothetical protein Tsubulata_014740 [Turnera subulata]|uniref:Protein kinase domain-containing protein n=1 Tax=Turnera subulata TaxID=218843 RepID=A0A9Q0GJD8_9ROSI|nr:hypothetical protein Tsubulata_014740 [Turnera subulata]